MSLNRAQTRGYMFLRIEGLGGQRIATEIDATGITDSTSFERSEAADGDFAGALIYLPNADAQYQIREAGLIRGPKLFQTGANYPIGLDLHYELYYQIHPYAVNEIIREALHELYGETEVPLSMWPDGDLSDSGVTHWNKGAISAPTKSTLYKAISNQRSLVVPTSGGNLYAQSDDVYVEPGDQIFHAAIGSIEATSSGTAYYALWDRINNRAIYEATFQSYRDQIIRRVDTIPPGCTKVAVRVGSTANGSTTVWKGFPSHPIGQGTSGVQGWIKERKNFLGFNVASYGRSTGPDRFNFTDRVIETWPDRDFRLMPFVPALTSYSLQINRGGGLAPEDYWIHGYRKMNELEDELDNEAAVTNIDDEDMFLTAVETLLCERLGGDYTEQARQGRSLLDAQRIARAVVQPTPERGIEMVGMRGNNRWGNRFWRW